MNKKELLRIKRHRRIKLRMHGDNAKPRLIIHRSLKHFSAQIVDDARNKVLFTMTTLDKEVKSQYPCAGNIKGAVFFGEVFARRAKEKGFGRVIFDRAGYLYHGRVRAFADAIRKGGLEF
ncbi:MAG: 50S ribosomal protein L18 [Candidatus Omnitrophota bacterium]